MRRNVVWLGCALAACLGFVAGCQQETGSYRPIDPNKVPITGEITYKGQPLSGAVITFKGQTPGVEGSGIEVKNGRFQLPQADGLVPGVYIVQFFDMASFTGDPGGPTGVDEQPMRITFPPEYSVKSKMTFEVKADGTNHLKLDLK